jgi:hypothetical protein
VFPVPGVGLMPGFAGFLSSSLVALTFLLPVGLHAQTQSSAARQRAAIQKACDSGVLSPDECQQKLAALGGGQSAAPAGGGASGATKDYKESHGRYTISIPAGWNVNIQPDSIKITQGDTWAIFETSSMSGQPLDVAKKKAAEMQSMYTSWQVFNQGPFTTGHKHPAGGMTIGATVNTKAGPKQVVMLFTSQSAGGGNFVNMTSSTDQATGRVTNGTLSQIFDSIRFAGE